MKASAAAGITHGKLNGNDVEFKNISIDTRTLKPGDLYVAIIGEHLDGHDFIQAAKEKGAAAVLISKNISTDFPSIIVDDTLKAFTDLAIAHRAQFHLPIVGITGSCGKTTTRAILDNIFSEAGKTLASVGSFNNHIGVPLTMLQLIKEHQYYVQEMGTNHFGEMRALSLALKPTVAILLGVAPVHLEGFGSVAGVSQAKTEIFEGLTENGTAIINADDVFASDWKKAIGNRRTISFGIKNRADIMARDIHIDENARAKFTLVFPEKMAIPVKLKLLGEHNVYNALAAAAAGFAEKLSPETIQRGLEKAEAVEKRLVPITTPSGVRIINDSYNANPQAVLAAIQVLKKIPGEKIVILGDMRELGSDEIQFHRDLGAEIKHQGITAFYGYGDLMKYATDRFGSGAQHFLDKAVLLAALQPTLSSKSVILVKGSKSMKMWEITEQLLNSSLQDA